MNWTDQNNAVLTPVHIAACSGEREAVRTLIENKCDVNARDM